MWSWDSLEKNGLYTFQKGYQEVELLFWLCLISRNHVDMPLLPYRWIPSFSVRHFSVYILRYSSGWCCLKLRISAEREKFICQFVRLKNNHPLRSIDIIFFVQQSPESAAFTTLSKWNSRIFYPALYTYVLMLMLSKKPQVQKVRNNFCYFLIQQLRGKLQGL